MKKLFIAIAFVLSLLGAILSLSACGGDGASGTTKDGYPAVSGSYERETTNCPTAFDSSVTVVQDEENVIIKGDSDDFLDVSGDLEKNGDFFVSNIFVDCYGEFVDGSATVNCIVNDEDVCVVTYSMK